MFSKMFAKMLLTLLKVVSAEDVCKLAGNDVNVKVFSEATNMMATSFAKISLKMLVCK